MPKFRVCIPVIVNTYYDVEAATGPDAIDSLWRGAEGEERPELEEFNCRMRTDVWDYELLD